MMYEYVHLYSSYSQRKLQAHVFNNKAEALLKKIFKKKFPSFEQSTTL